MPIVSVRIPQIGEGLQEARLVAVLKQPGEKVRRDEPIYQMETDKAVMDVESPYEGTLVEWLAPVDSVLPIGGEVARMDVVEGTAEVGAPTHGHGPAETQAHTHEAPAARLQGVPPRTRAYAKEKGVSEEVLATLRPAGSKLMPDDIDRYLEAAATGGGAGPTGATYTEAPLPGKQRLLASRMVRGSQLVVPGTMTVVANWSPIENLRTRQKATGGEFQPSAFTMFAYCVAQALREHPAFRSSLIGDDTVRTYEHANLGIAVGLPGDELVLAVVEDSDTLDWPAFAQRTRERIDEARTGKDQANESVTISLTNMQAFGLREAVPVVVPPSVGTLFLGEVYHALSSDTDAKVERVVNLTLTFDHRLINGVGAANFLNAVKQNVETVGGLISVST